jgi:acetylglutamate kinase
MEPGDVILRFLESVGTRSETEYYLALFRAESKERFATIAVDAAVVRHAFDALAIDLRYLAGLNLYPVVVLGHVEPDQASEHAQQIARGLLSAGVGSLVLSAGAPLPEILAGARSGAITIVHFDRQLAGLDDRFARLGEITRALGTRKLIFLGRRGGLRTRAGTGISIVNLSAEEPALDVGLSKKQRGLLAQSRRLLQESPRMLIAVTSPLTLLRELFTVKGAGTLVKQGTKILRKDRYEDLDRDRLRRLLESSFEKPVSLGFFDRPALRILLEEDYRGAAILQEAPMGAFLTKFAVTQASQGEGIGRDVWDVLCAEFPVFFWRARPENPISSWYVSQCDGMIRGPAWMVFWRGLPTAQIPAAIDHALAAPMDFES